MDLWEFNLEEVKLVPKAHAQALDGESQPTFGPLELSAGGGTQAEITLTADNTSTEVGKNFDVDIEIETGDFTISEYRLVINYDSNVLSARDADPTTSGTQVEFLDTVFETEENGNIVQTGEGRITVVAKTPSGNALQVNRPVARVTFQAQTIGDTTISPQSVGVEGTQLINRNGVALPTTLNDVTIGISQAGDTSSSTTTSTTSTTSSTATTSDNTDDGAGDNDTNSSLPSTGIGDGLINVLPLIIGMILILLGASLSRVRKRTHSNAKN